MLRFEQLWRLPMPHDFDNLDHLSIRPHSDMFVLAERYQVVRELGRGAMGTVYLAHDLKLDGRPVAIKMPAPVLARNKRAVASLKREAVTAMQLSHPHIVTLRAFEQAEEGVFLVMDYVEGQTLDDLLAEKGTLSEAEIVPLFTPIAQALDYAHSKGVIHRDIKPANIMITPTGVPLVMDFSVARELHETFTRTTGRSGSSGTLPYMSPQQLQGETPHPSQDIYSLAATIYDCVAGHPPFHRGAIEHQIVNREPQTVEGCGAFGAALLKGLAKSDKQRPETCAAILTEVANCSQIPPQAVSHAQQVTESTARDVESLAQLITNSIDCKLVYVSPGAFTMGSQSPTEMRCEITCRGGFLWLKEKTKEVFQYEGGEEGRRDDETQHRVILSRGFYMGTTPVTQGQWRAVMGNNPSHFADKDHRPVEQVSWHDAVRFCQRLTERERAAGLIGPNQSYRLPTEAEWEYACRAGTTTRFYTGNTKADLARAAWYDGNSDRQTHPVGQKAPNAWGLYDMHGNVLEWCSDWFGDYPRGEVTDPPGPATGKGRVVRGGSWLNHPSRSRSANRNNIAPDNRCFLIGFRVVLDLPH